jgi:hypothetical protein
MTEPVTTTGEVQDVSNAQTQHIVDELEETYKVFAAKMMSFANHGVGVSLFNFDEIIKQVMETVEVLGNVKVMSGKEKAHVAQEFVLRILKDLHDANKISNDFFIKSSEAMANIGPSIFTVVSMASQGKIVINGVLDVVESTDCGKKHCGNAKCTIL